MPSAKLNTQSEFERLLGEPEKKNLPAIGGQALPAEAEIVGADAYLNRNPTMMIGRIIKFNGKTGQIIHTDDETAVSPDQKYVVLVDNIWCGKARLEEGQPAKYAGGLLFSKGFRLPSREELGDTEPALWPISKFDNGPADPWKEAVFIPMEERGLGELYTLQIVSKPRSAAIFATDGLLRHCQAMRHRMPDVYPIIMMEMKTYDSKRYGKQWKPTFRYVGTVPKASAAKPDTSLAADMNDEIGI